MPKVGGSRSLVFQCLDGDQLRALRGTNGSSTLRIGVVGVTWLRQKLRGSVVVESTRSFPAGFVEFLQGLGNPALDDPPSSSAPVGI